MSETISRMYGNLDQAQSAVSELKEHGWGDADVSLVGPSNGASTDEIAATIMKGRVLRYRAKRYADRVSRGGVLVTVNAPFATATTAARILDSHGPVDSGVNDPAPDYLTWEDSAPLSSSLHVPVLTSNDASLSAFCSLSTLTSSHASLSRALGLPELTSSKAAISDAIGLPTLSRNPAPLSSLLHLPVLRRSRR